MEISFFPSLTSVQSMLSVCWNFHGVFYGLLSGSESHYSDDILTRHVHFLLRTFNLEATFGYFNNKETVLCNLKWRQF